MTKENSLTTNANRSWADAAVDGLWPGLVGGVLMLLYLLLTGLISGSGPEEVFSYFLPQDDLPAITGLALHLATSAVYGAAFGLISAAFGRRLSGRLPLLIAGLLFGCVLWLGAWLVVVPSGMSNLGAVPAGHLITAHALYGLGTGRLLSNSRP